MNVAKSGAATEILDEALRPANLTGDAERHPVLHDGKLACALALAQVITTDDATDISFTLIGRRLRRDQAGTAKRVTPDKSTLSPFQDSDVAKIKGMYVTA